MQVLWAFINMLCRMAPYLLLGFLVAGILHEFVPASFFNKHLSKENFKSVLWATLLGIPLPLCSCGVIPTAISLRKDGASRGATVAFMVATPQTGIDSIIATYSMMGLPFAIVRPVIALVTALAGGMVTSWVSKDEVIVRRMPTCVVKKKFGRRIIDLLKYSFIELIQNIGKWLFIGLVVGALITVLIPDSFFTELRLPDIVTMLIVLLIAIPMYTCSMGSIPIAAALILKGLSPGTALVLLVAGPAANVASMLIVGKVFGKKQLLFYLGSIIVGSILGGLFIDLLPIEWFRNPIMQNMNMDNLAHGTTGISWFEIISGIIIMILLIYVYIIMKLFKKKTVSDESHIVYVIGGMTCNHCKNSVQKAIKDLKNVEEVVVDLDTKEAVVTGHPDDKAVKKAVEELGFEFKGKR